MKIQYLLDNFTCFDYETVDPYIGLNMGGGWVYSICYPEVCKSRTISCGIWEESSKSMKYYEGNYRLALEDKYHNILVGQNIAYDIGWYIADNTCSKQEAIKTLRQKYMDGVLLIDTKILARLVDEHGFDYSLGGLTKKYGVTQKSSHLLADAVYDCGLYNKLKPTKSGKPRKRPSGKEGDKRLLKIAYTHMDQLPNDIVKEYCLDDVKGTAELYKVLVNKLLEEYTEEQLYTQIKKYSDLIYCNLEMRINGIPLSIDRLKESNKQLHNKLKEAEQHFIELSKGHKLSVTLSDHLYQYFLINGMSEEDFIKTPETGRYSFKKAWFEDHPCEAVDAVVRLKKIKKAIALLDTFRSIQDELHMSEQEYGTVHGEFNVFGTQTSRFSASSPNLQQVTKRDKELYPICRGPFLVPKEYKLCAADYASQEQRIQVHFAYLLGMPGSKQVRDEWVKNPYMDFHDKVAELTNTPRPYAKGINFGLSFGMGEAKLCTSLGMPIEYVQCQYNGTRPVAGPEGKAIIDQYHSMLPFMKATINYCNDSMKKKEHIKLLGGRKAHIARTYDNGRPIKKAWKAFSQLIQGSAAQQLIQSMVDYYEYICYNEIYDLKLRAVVHDEMIFTFPSEKEKEYVEKIDYIMSNSIPLEVPMIVGCSVGQSWYEEKKE